MAAQRFEEMTAFIFRLDIFQFEVMPFRLMNTRSKFQRIMNDHIGNLAFVKVHLDNFVVFSTTIQEHVEHITQVVHLVAGYGLKVKISKCEFAKEMVTPLRHFVGKSSVHVNPSKVEIIQTTPCPARRTGPCSFQDIAGYY